MTRPLLHLPALAADLQRRSALQTPTAPPEQLLGLPGLQTRGLLELQTRAAPEGDGTFDGYACVWDVRDAYGTSFRRGCFLAGGLDQAAYALCWMHDPTQPLGIFYAVEDDHGLKINGRWDDTPEGQTGRTRAHSGSAAGLSVGFVPSGVDPEDETVFTVCRLVETSQITARMAAVPGSALVGVRGATASEEATQRRRAQIVAARLRLLPEPAPWG